MSRKRGRSMKMLVRALPILLVALVLGACTSVDLDGLAQQLRSRVAAASPASADEAAVRSVIDGSNRAQATAVASGDPTPMPQYTTSAFYQELLQTDRA